MWGSDGMKWFEPLVRRIESHTFPSERIHGYDTTVPVLALGKTVAGRIWSYVKDAASFGGTAPPSAMFYCSRTGPPNIRRGIWPILAASFRRTPIRAMASFIFLIEVRARFMRRRVGRMPGDHSLRKPIWRATRAEKGRLKVRQSSSRSP